MSVPERREDLAAALRAALTAVDEPARVGFVPPMPATPPSIDTTRPGTGTVAE